MQNNSWRTSAAARVAGGAERNGTKAGAGQEGQWLSKGSAKARERADGRVRQYLSVLTDEEQTVPEELHGISLPRRVCCPVPGLSLSLLQPPTSSGRRLPRGFSPRWEQTAPQCSPAVSPGAFPVARKSGLTSAAADTRKREISLFCPKPSLRVQEIKRRQRGNAGAGRVPSPRAAGPQGRRTASPRAPPAHPALLAGR